MRVPLIVWVLNIVISGLIIEALPILAVPINLCNVYALILRGLLSLL